MASQPTSVPPVLQNFLEAGQTLAQGFFSYLSGQQPSLPGAAPALPVPRPEEVARLQQDYLNQHIALWNAMLAKGRGEAVDFQVAPEAGDRRFNAPEWQASPTFDYLRQAYLLNSRYLMSLVDQVPLEEDKVKSRLRFLARQYVDALSPANYAATNPEFIRLAVETKGKNITEGVKNLIGDLEKGHISMSDENAFQVGRNLAVTEGSVVYENELIQLIQYVPRTPRVAKRPLLIVPPCINKFYILDLQAENSFVRYAVESGQTVFMLSWRNPKGEQGRLGWEDYLEQGPLAAIEAVRSICRVDQINALGFCVGGTLLSSALAVLAGRGEAPVASLTLLATLLDFSDTGEIGLLVDENFVALKESQIGQGGLLTARELGTTFSALRANDLVWNYVANNYLKGQTPPPFDLLYWNCDSTNLPGPFACWYLRNMYLHNHLRLPGKLEMCGVRVDLARVDMPNFILATREDHIVPWQTAYQSTRLLGGESRFLLGASGHIAGIVNPPAKHKRSYWTNSDLKVDADAWLAGAEEHKGSWWPAWSEWIGQYAGGEVAARTKLGNSRYKPTEAAPGRYVKEMA